MASRPSQKQHCGTAQQAPSISDTTADDAVQRLEVGTAVGRAGTPRRLTLSDKSCLGAIAIPYAAFDLQT
jgi:hypothetical protein